MSRKLFNLLFPTMDEMFVFLGTLFAGVFAGAFWLDLSRQGSPHAIWWGIGVFLVFFAIFNWKPIYTILTGHGCPWNPPNEDK